jgi:hypothetical protein
MHKADSQAGQSEVQRSKAKKNMVKKVLEDMMQRQAIVSQLPGIDAKVVRPKDGKRGE